MKHSKFEAGSIDSGLAEIDSLFSAGELARGGHGRKASDRLTESRDAERPGQGGFAALHHRPAQDQHRKPQHPRSFAEVPILRVPEWSAHRWLAHGFSTRAGGVSTVYQRSKERDAREACGELNLGLTASDLPDNVLRNREKFVRAILNNTGKMPLRLLHQIHSGLVQRAEDAGNAADGSTGAMQLRGDGWIATIPGVLVGIQTADCVPVLVADLRQRIVAAFHAGWRGTLARIVERGVGRLRAEFGSQSTDLTAAIGPAIGPCCYSVGEEVQMEFQSQFAYADELFQEVFDLDPIKEKYPMLFLTARAPGHSNLGPSLNLDLAAANRHQLLDAGLAPEAIHSLNLCTACNTDRFFSHRAEHGFTGRMISAIGVR